MGSYRFMFAFATSLAIQSVTLLAVSALGDTAEAWRTVAIVYAIIGLIVNTLSVFSVKELPEEEFVDTTDKAEIEKDEKYGLVEAAKLLVSNKYYLMICVTYILQQIYALTFCNDSAVEQTTGCTGNKASQHSDKGGQTVVQHYVHNNTADDHNIADGQVNTAGNQQNAHCHCQNTQHADLLENCDNVIDANKIRVDTRNNYDNQCDNDCQKDPLVLKNIFSRRKASLFISHLYLLPMHV